MKVNSNGNGNNTIESVWPKSDIEILLERIVYLEKKVKYAELKLEGILDITIKSNVDIKA